MNTLEGVVSFSSLQNDVQWLVLKTINWFFLLSKKKMLMKTSLFEKAKAPPAVHFRLCV